MKNMIAYKVSKWLEKNFSLHESSDVYTSNREVIKAEVKLRTRDREFEREMQRARAGMVCGGV